MTKFFVLPALILGSASLTACSGQGFGGHNTALGCNLVADNCAPGTYGAHSSGQYGQYGGGNQSAYGYGASYNQGYGQRHSYGQAYGMQGQGTRKSRYGTYTELAGYQQFTYANAAQPYAAQPYAYQSYRPQISTQLPALRTAASYQTSMVTAAAPANCPAGTTAQADGTCLQGSSYASARSYSALPSYTSTNTSYSTPVSTSHMSSSHMSGAPMSCPAGTKPISDGTCLQTGESYSFSSSTASYASTPSYSASTPSYSSSSTDRAVPPPISQYDWGSANNSYGLGGSYTSSASSSVQAPNSYVSVENGAYGSSTNYSYEPIRK